MTKTEIVKEQPVPPFVQQSIVSVTTSDIAAIQTTIDEGNLLNLQAEFRDAIEDLNSNIESNESLIQDMIQERAAQKLSGDASKIEEQINKLFGARGDRAVCKLDNFKLIESSMTIDCEMKLSSGKDTVSFSARVEIAKSSELAGLIKETQNLRKNKSNVERRLVAVEQQLNNIGRIERASKARVTVAALNQTEEGRQFLKSMKIDTDKVTDVNMGLLEESSGV